MRLINTATLVGEQFIGSQIPKYAILSHTWEANEATFEDLTFKGIQTGGNAGVKKARKACSLARNDGYNYIWVDTCCINKSSSSELTEAINSMFKWYQSAEVCYVYLSDLRSDDLVHDMGKCRWFTRGWTLQELVAPKVMKFYDEAWKFRGTKTELLGTLVRKTNVPEGILTGRKGLQTIPVGAKISWAAHRTTTREEDIAYCLLGLFDVNMPLIYGEGPKAFIRLQEEIIRQTNDLTIFYWRDENDDACRYRGVLANSPTEFKCAASIKFGPQAMINLDKPEFTMTNKGIRINMPLISYSNTDLVFMYLVPKGDPNASVHTIDGDLSGIWLKRYDDGLYARARPKDISEVKFTSLGGCRTAQRYLTKTVGPETVETISPAAVNSCKFWWNSKSPLYEYISTTPSAWWDNERKVFLAGSNSDFVAYHLFRTTWDWQPSTGADDVASTDHRFLILFGISRNEKAWFIVWRDFEFGFSEVLDWADLGKIQRRGEKAFHRLGNYPQQTIQLFSPKSLDRKPGIDGSDSIQNTSEIELRVWLSSFKYTSNSGWHVEIKFDDYF